MSVFTEHQRATLNAIIDTFVAALDAEEEEQLINKILSIPNNRFTRKQISDYAKTSGSDTHIIDKIEKKLPRVLSPAQYNQFILLLNVMNYRLGSFLLTGYFAPIQELSRPQREEVILKWKNSYFSIFSQVLYVTFMALSIVDTYRELNCPLFDGYKYDGIDGEAYFKAHPDYKPIKRDTLHMLSLSEATVTTRYDVIVVGSGAGGGVVASELAEAGYSVLVIEKGPYYNEEMFVPEESPAYNDLYESSGMLCSTNNSISLLAGSCVGGGTTVNHLASLKTPDYIREEWASFGLPYFVSPQFTHDTDKVWNVIGASTENIEQSGSNRKLIEGCNKLGYPVEIIPQNTSGRPHHCGKCYAGCTSGIKNSIPNTWLKHAATHDAKFLDKTRVTRILIENGRAVGVECKIHDNTVHSYYARRVIVAAGALHTPCLLKKSGLKNSHIGSHVWLHPTIVCNSYFNEDLNPAQGSQLTAVSTVARQIDGDYYGIAIECFNSGMGIYAGAANWEGALKHKEHILRHRNSATIFALLREKDTVSSIQYDENDHISLEYKLSTRDSRVMAEGVTYVAKIVVAAGARKVQIAFHLIESFEFQDDEPSSIDNPRFIEWLDRLCKVESPVTSSGHQMGSCRMGSSPKNSGAKETGETWETRNLYVADASLFPTSLGINPMVTVEVIALQVARSVIESMKEEDILDAGI
ncbi:hypothetical protein BDB01DRAFT_769549 [Pilobolus umbonatus]|nr:hypothetical protein BDB01DRAFT_769549 [Pilobolus umbonatus]